MFEVVCLDLDNTLYDHTIAETQAYQAVLNFLNEHVRHLEWTMSDILAAKSRVKKQVQTYERMLYFQELLSSHAQHIDDYLETVMVCNALFWNTFITCIKPYKGVLDTLKLLRKMNIRIVVVSNFDTAYQIKKLKALELLHLIDDMYTSQSVGVSKPNPLIFQAATKGYNMSKCCMIGDDFECDFQGAKEAGMFTVLFDPEFNYTAMDTYSQQLIIRSWEQFHAFLCTLSIKLKYFVSLCHRVGERSDLTQGAGGNVSIKWHLQEYNKDEYWMIIKASGCNLGDVGIKSGWSLVKNNERDSTFDLVYGDKPSIETGMHLVLNYPIVIHCHPTDLIVWLHDPYKLPMKDMEYIVVPYIPPGPMLAEALQEYANTPCIYLQNHGVILGVDTYDLQHTMSLLNQACQSEDHEVMMNAISFSAGNKGITHRYSQLCTLDQETLSHIATPDCAVFLQSFVNELSEAHIKDRVVVVPGNGYLYVHASTLQQAKVMLEMLDTHVKLLNKSFVSLHFTHLSTEQTQQLTQRQDEKYRLEK